MKSRFILALVILYLPCNLAIAQTNKLDKKLEKANELIDKNKLDDADKYLEGLLEKNTDFGKGWDLLVQVRLAEYKNAKQLDNMFSSVTVTTKSKNGTDTVKNDTLANKLMEMLNNVKPSKKAYNKFIYTAREATLMSDNCDYSSFFLRNIFVDIQIDTNVSEKALKYFSDAESEFSNKNYQKAALLYKRALDEQPDFYKASMYLGDAYYFQGFYVDAAKAFKSCVDRFPFLLEPRKYLIDTYAKEGMYTNSLDECIAAEAIYPDYSLKQKLDDAAYLCNKKLTITWTPRPVLPNKINRDSSSTDLNTYTPDKELKAKGPWIYYTAAQDKIKDYCNDKGVITKPNSLTQSQYLEVYSWEEMLKNSNDPSLDEARKMQKAGFLDCYVLISCFHLDFYQQYKDFVAKNKSKVTDYFNKFIN